MANEFTKVELYGANNDGTPRRYKIADATSVSQGATLALSDPRTVVATSKSTIINAGVAAEDHGANLGVTDISVWTDGIFEAVASDAITVGSPITFVESNKIQAARNAASGASIAGYALETAAAGETINVRVQL